jgi:hypothetical protein
MYPSEGTDKQTSAKNAEMRCRHGDGFGFFAKAIKIHAIER